MPDAKYFELGMVCIDGDL